MLLSSRADGLSAVTCTALALALAMVAGAEGFEPPTARFWRPALWPVELRPFVMEFLQTKTARKGIAPLGGLRCLACWFYIAAPWPRRDFPPGQHGMTCCAEKVALLAFTVSPLDLAEIGNRPVRP